MSYDIMYTDWNFPSGSNRTEFWIGQRYTNATSTSSVGAWKGVTQHNLPVVGENGETTYKTYICNTNIFDLETLIEFITGSFDTVDEEDGGEGSTSKPEYINIQEWIDKIPFQNIIKQLEITVYNGENDKISPATDLINYLIVNATGSAVDTEWLKESLEKLYNKNQDETYVLEGVSESSRKLAEKIVNFLNATTEEERANIANDEDGYKGVTVQAMLDSLKFGDDWTDEYKKHDSENLVDIIFLIIDLVGNLGGESEGAVATSDETNLEGEGDATAEGNDLTAIFDLIKTLGVAFDKMAETHCIGDLPYLMIKGLLTSDMLSMAMLPSMYGEYVAQIDAINANYDLPELERDEDLTYAKFMDDFVNTFKGLIDKIGGVGGFM